MNVRVAHIYTVQSRSRKKKHGGDTERNCISFVQESSMNLCVGLHQVCMCASVDAVS